jgi:hypothetical protein
MSFENFVPPLLSPEQSGAMPDIIGKILGGYTAMTNARYLQPTLAEALKQSQLANRKTQLENQYYGPNIQSEMGLRQAQQRQALANAGLLGEQTSGEHLKNKYLPEEYRLKLNAALLKAQEDQKVSEIIQRKLAGMQGGGMQGGGMPQPQDIASHIARGIMAPGHETEATEMPGSIPGAMAAQGMTNVPRETMPQTAPQTSQGYGNPPELTAEDIINQHMGFDSYTPKLKSYYDAQKEMQTESAKTIQARKSETSKNVLEAQNSLPDIQSALHYAQQMQTIVKNNPAIYGHRWRPDTGPWSYARASTDPAAGTMQTLIVPALAKIQSSLSERGSQKALAVALTKLPQFSDSHEVAQAKANALVDLLQDELKRTQQAAGGNVITIGGKRFIIKNGKTYELEEGE